MKRRKLLLIVFVALLIGLLSWWLWPSGIKPPAATLSPTRPPVVAQVPVSNPILVAKPPPTTPIDDAERYIPTTLPVIPANVYGAMSSDQQAQANTFQRAMDQENQKAINFYGKVVDQHGQPVVEARVRGNVLLNNTMTASRSEDYFTTTNKNGEFRFTDLHGTEFGVEPSKPGYEYNHDQKVNWSKSYKPDPTNPMVFTLYKLQGAELTISDDKFYGIKSDGEIYTIDLIKGKKAADSAAEGDLHVTIQRPAVIQHNQKFDWSFSMEAVDGGLIQTADPYLNEAPGKGYQGKFEVKMSASDPKWVNKFTGMFYIKSRNGKVYGQIKIEVLPIYQDQSVFNMQSTVNPTGSRNLETDPNKNIKAGSPNAQLSLPSTTK